MKYHVSLKRLADGHYYARCVSAPNGLAESYGVSSEEALDKLGKEIRFRLEYCPCSGVARESIELNVKEAGTDRNGARLSPRPPSRWRS